jgi:TRAP-type C4-dicarboxylate transport system substrate-binding protein
MKKTLLLITFIFFSVSVYAEPIKLTLHHFFVPQDVPQKQMLEPWAREVEKLSNNQVKITIVPRMGRGGKPKDLIPQATEGRIADMIWTVNTYSGKPFPSSEVFELPFIHRNDPIATNLAMREMFDSDLKREYDQKNLEVMFLHVHQGHAFLTNRYELRTPDQVRGKRVRVPGRIHQWISEELGGITVPTTVRQIPQLLQRRAVDTVLITANIIKPLKMQSQVTAMTEGPNGTRFANAVLTVAMNKNKWNSLPPDVQDAFRQASNEEWLKKVGKIWRDYEKPGMQELKTFRKKIIVLNEDEIAQWEKALEPVTERWIQDVEKDGIDGRKLVEKAKRLVEKYSNR